MEETTGEAKVTKSARNRSGGKKVTIVRASFEKRKRKRRESTVYAVHEDGERRGEVAEECEREREREGKGRGEKARKRSKTDAAETSFTRSRDFADQTQQLPLPCRGS